MDQQLCGQILQSFYIQPAAAILCRGLVVVAFLALLKAVFGLYFRFPVRINPPNVWRIKAKYVVFVLIVIIAADWLVTLGRALAAEISW